MGLNEILCDTKPGLGCKKLFEIRRFSQQTQFNYNRAVKKVPKSPWKLP